MQLTELDKQFIEGSDVYKKFSIGDKVKVVSPTHKVYDVLTAAEIWAPESIEYGIIDSFDISWNNIVYPVVLKCKKNGEKSKRELFYDYNVNNLEKCE